MTSLGAQPPPQPVEKPVEKKPDPPKPVTENKPKEEPKPIEKQPDPPKVDPIAEALKSEESKKPKPKQEAKAAPPQPPKPKQERVFDQTRIAALLDKRDPTHQSITGATLNASASLGSSRGTAATLSQSELAAMRARLHELWNVPPGIRKSGGAKRHCAHLAEPGSPSRRPTSGGLKWKLAARPGCGRCGRSRPSAGPALYDAARRDL